jgi:hypothetical protein
MTNNNPFEGKIETRSMLVRDFEQIVELTPVEIECIRLWCKQLTPIKTINTKCSSYRLKHLCEQDLGFYVPNGIIKQIMTKELGFTMDDHYTPNGINEFYNVSMKSINNRPSLHSQFRSDEKGD